jgi:hypothetical protein
MREDNYGNTEPPSIGGSVDYFYIGAYDGGDDVLGGILDKLLSGSMEYSEHTNDVFMPVEGGFGVQTGGYDTCGGRKHHKHNGKKNPRKKSPRNEDGPVTLTPGPCAYGDCPVNIKDDEDESLVVVSEPPANTDVGETEHEPDPSDDNSLVVVKKVSPLIIESSYIREMRNEDLDKSIPRSVSDAFFDDTDDDPLVVKPNIFSVKPSEKPSEKEGRGEVQDVRDNIKMEDYKVVANYIKKYVETINKKVF